MSTAEAHEKDEMLVRVGRWCPKDYLVRKRHPHGIQLGRTYNDPVVPNTAEITVINMLVSLEFL